MYKTVNTLLNKNTRDLPDCNSPAILADDFCKYFADKVEKIRKEVDATYSSIMTTMI
jgi:hypothetical protein